MAGQLSEQILKELGIIQGKLDGIKDTVKNHHDRMNRIDVDIQGLRKHIDILQDKLDGRIRANEKRLWTIAGIMAAISSISTLVVRYLLK